MCLVKLGRFAFCLTLLLCGAPAMAEDTATAPADDPGVIEGDLPFYTPDMTAFNATCRASVALRDLLTDAPGGPDAAREAVCACIGDAFPLQFQQSVVDMLAKELDGTASDAERQAFLNYATFSSQADTLMGQCVAQLD